MPRAFFPLLLIVLSLFRMAMWDSLQMHVLSYGFSVIGLIVGIVWLVVVFIEKKH